MSFCFGRTIYFYMDRFKRWLENIIPLPIVHQSHNYDCGACCLRAICLYYGVGSEDEDEFIKACDTDSKDGTHPDEIVKAAKIFGLKTAKIEGMTIRQLQTLIDQNRPVICAIQAWEEDDKDYSDNDSGHYVIAIGYDDNHILFQDPSIHTTRRGRLTHEDFEERWHDIDKDHRIMRHLGIVLWRNEQPEDTDHLKRSDKIE